MDTNEDFKITSFPALDGAGKPERHYAVWDVKEQHLIAFCNYESSAIAVCDDAIRRARIAEHKSTSTLATASVK